MKAEAEAEADATAAATSPTVPAASVAVLFCCCFRIAAEAGASMEDEVAQEEEEADEPAVSRWCCLPTGPTGISSCTLPDGAATTAGFFFFGTYGTDRQQTKQEQSKADQTDK